jgi:hypothetical protein
MKITIEMTADVVQWKGINSTAWLGRTEGGIPVAVLVRSICCTDPDQQKNFENEMALTSPGTPRPRGIPATDEPILTRRNPV